MTARRWSGTSQISWDVYTIALVADLTTAGQFESSSVHYITTKQPSQGFGSNSAVYNVNDHRLVAVGRSVDVGMDLPFLAALAGKLIILREEKNIDTNLKEPMVQRFSMGNHGGMIHSQQHHILRHELGGIKAVSEPDDASRT